MTNQSQIEYIKKLIFLQKSPIRQLNDRVIMMGGSLIGMAVARRDRFDVYLFRNHSVQAVCCGVAFEKIVDVVADRYHP